MSFRKQFCPDGSSGRPSSRRCPDGDDGAARQRSLLLLFRQSQEATARAEARATRAEAALASAEAMRAQAEQVVRITVLIRS